MSKIGTKPIEIPANVAVSLEDGRLIVRGPKGELSRPIPELLKVEIADHKVFVQRLAEAKLARGLHGLFRAVAANLIEGVTTGFKRVLEIKGVGFKAEVAGPNLKLAVGFSHPVNLPIPQGIEVKVEGPLMVVSGLDKERVGTFAATVRAVQPVEPYKGKGIRYQGERVILKAGKSAKSATASSLAKST